MALFKNIFWLYGTVTQLSHFLYDGPSIRLCHDLCLTTGVGELIMFQSDCQLTLFRSGGYQIDTCLPFSLPCYMVFALNQSNHIE